MKYAIGQKVWVKPMHCFGLVTRQRCDGIVEVDTGPEQMEDGSWSSGRNDVYEYDLELPAPKPPGKFYLWCYDDEGNRMYAEIHGNTMHWLMDFDEPSVTMFHTRVEADQWAQVQTQLHRETWIAPLVRVGETK